MSNIVIVGMQWGDEGKGKIVDLVCPAFDGVVRFQGGNNAGHTVKFADQHFSLHLIPSGILHPGMRCFLGNGMVIPPDAFLEELGRLKASGVEVGGRLFISSRATVVLPWHIDLDRAREAARGAEAIGTTCRGIGPAYESKASRGGLRICDLRAADLEDRLAALDRRIRNELEMLDPEIAAAALGVEEVAALCRGWGKSLEPYVRDTEYLLYDAIAEGKSLLFEGAQGALLDIDQGTYPYVTSSSTVTGGATTGSGIPPTALDEALGILKAYSTRVGAGPFVSETPGEIGEYLQSRGNELGTTTGRLRRCGWLDTVAGRYGRLLNGVGAIALTKLDVLDTLDEIRVCVAYRIDGQEVRRIPADRAAQERAEPVYLTVPGWNRDTSGILEFEDLPQAARDYVELIEREVGAPVALVSTGPRREETILRRHPATESLFGTRLNKVLAARGA